MSKRAKQNIIRQRRKKKSRHQRKMERRKLLKGLAKDPKAGKMIQGGRK